MRRSNRTAFLGGLFVTLAATAYIAPVSADAVSDCRQEAQDYGIHAEGVDDYVEGCLASRGELIVEEEVAVDYMPPEEVDREPAVEEETSMDIESPVESDEEPVEPMDDADAAR
jgi:hypothetical protein